MVQTRPRLCHEHQMEIGSFALGNGILHSPDANASETGRTSSKAWLLALDPRIVHLARISHSRASARPPDLS
jgi:hypothetical protein